MIPVPEITKMDFAFGNIDHLPKYETIPDEFKDPNSHSRWNLFASHWFFGMLKKNDIDNLKPKDGIDKIAALKACRAILLSFEPQHEHKEAGVAYLLSEWFE